jgi:arsenate reductase
MERPLSSNELKRLLHIGGLRPQEVIRTNEAAYHQYVADRNLSDEQLVRVMVEHPELIQRPIVVLGDKAVLARPIDRLTELGIK